MSIDTINRVIQEEIVAPGLTTFVGMSKEEFKAEIYDIVECGCHGVGLDIALFALSTANFEELYFNMLQMKNKRKFTTQKGAVLFDTIWGW